MSKKNQRKAVVNAAAQIAFEAIVELQEAMAVLHREFGALSALDVLLVKDSAERLSDLSDELDYDITSLPRIRNHVAKIARLTNESGS